MTHRVRNQNYPQEDLIREVRDVKKHLKQASRSHKGSEWYSWTAPTWVGATSNPVLGDGLLELYYQRTGQLVNIKMCLRIGTTTTMGSGAWSFGLPFPPVGFPGFFDAGVMSAVAQDDSAGLRYPGIAHITTDIHIWRVVFGQGTSGASPTAPFTWAVGDILMVSGFYETDQ